jgi:hypothetical protein
MRSDAVKVSGYIFLQLFDSSGKLKEEREIRNVVTNSGHQYLVDLLCGHEQDTMKYVAIGTGDAAAAATNSDMDSEVGTRAGGTVTDSGKTYQIEHTFGSGDPAAAVAIQEAGLFSTASGGTLGSRQQFATINKGTSDSLKITWRWVFS